MSHVRLSYKSPEAAWGGPLSGIHIQRGSCRVLLYIKPTMPCTAASERHICTILSLPMAFIPCLMTEEYESPKDLHQGRVHSQGGSSSACLPVGPGRGVTHTIPSNVLHTYLPFQLGLPGPPGPPGPQGPPGPFIPSEVLLKEFRLLLKGKGATLWACVLVQVNQQGKVQYPANTCYVAWSPTCHGAGQWVGER